MNEVKTLEQLQNERARLKIRLKVVEQEINDDIYELNDRFQPIIKFMGYVKNKIMPVTSGASKLIVPMLAGRLSKGVKGAAKGSIVTLATTFAAEYLLSKVNLASIMGKLAGFITKRKRKHEDNDDFE